MPPCSCRRNYHNSQAHHRTCSRLSLSYSDNLGFEVLEYPTQSRAPCFRDTRVIFSPTFPLPHPRRDIASRCVKRLFQNARIISCSRMYTQKNPGVSLSCRPDSRKVAMTYSPARTPPALSIPLHRSGEIPIPRFFLTVNEQRSLNKFLTLHCRKRGPGCRYPPPVGR